MAGTTRFLLVPLRDNVPSSWIGENPEMTAGETGGRVREQFPGNSPSVDFLF